MILHCSITDLRPLTDEAQAIIRMMMEREYHSHDVRCEPDSEGTIGLRWSWAYLNQARTMIQVGCLPLFGADQFAGDLTGEEVEALSEMGASAMFGDIREARREAQAWITEETRIAECDAAESNRFGNGWHNNEDI